MEAAEGRLVRLGGLELRFLADERDSAGELVMFELSVPPQARVPAPHYHDRVDEVVYGLGGTLTTKVDGRTYEYVRATPSSSRGGACTTTRTCTSRPRALSSS